MARSVNGSAIKKLKLVFTVVDRSKAEFYLDVLSQFGVNCQMVVGGMGTANSEIIDILGLNIHKAVIVSVVREDQTPAVMNCLEEKFESIKNGKGISFAVPMSSVMGVSLYQFLSNYRQDGRSDHEDQ